MRIKIILMSILIIVLASIVSAETCTDLHCGQLCDIAGFEDGKCKTLVEWFNLGITDYMIVPDYIEVEAGVDLCTGSDENNPCICGCKYCTAQPSCIAAGGKCRINPNFLADDPCSLYFEEVVGQGEGYCKFEDCYCCRKIATTTTSTTTPSTTTTTTAPPGACTDLSCKPFCQGSGMVDGICKKKSEWIEIGLSKWVVESCGIQDITERTSPQPGEERTGQALPR